MASVAIRKVCVRNRKQMRVTRIHENPAMQIIEKCKGYPLIEISIPATNAMSESKTNNNFINLLLCGIRSA
jgi:hypothetical protein